MEEIQAGAADSTLDALVPAAIARKAEAIGAQKARLDFASLIVLSVLAGAFIALGAMFATTVMAGADGTVPFGISRLLAGVSFSLGLILVIVGGAELFTGNTLMVMALAARKIALREMLRAWTIVYVGNFVGAMVAFIAAHRLGRLKAREPVQPKPPQDAADGRGRHANFGRDMLAGAALPAQGFDGSALGWRRLAWR